MMPVEDIDYAIKELRRRLPKLIPGRDPNTYYSGREEGLRTAYSDAIRMLQEYTKKYRSK